MTGREYKYLRAKKIERLCKRFLKALSKIEKLFPRCTGPNTGGYYPACTPNFPKGAPDPIGILGHDEAGPIDLKAFHGLQHTSSIVIHGEARDGKSVQLNDNFDIEPGYRGNQLFEFSIVPKRKSPPPNLDHFTPLD